MNKRIETIAPSVSLTITAKAKALAAAGKTIFSFAAGETDFDTPEPIKAAAVKALAEGQTKYAPVPGLPLLRQKIAAKLRKSGPGMTLPDWLDSKGVVYRPKPGDPKVCQLPECPWSSEHASGTDGWGHAAVFSMSGDGKWAFSCCHATCRERGRGWRDFADLVAPRLHTVGQEFKLGFGRRVGTR